MATARPPVAAEATTMSTPTVIKVQRSIRTKAHDQKFAKAVSITTAEAEIIAEEGAKELLAETGSEELARQFKEKMIRILPGAVSW